LAVIGQSILETSSGVWRDGHSVGESQNCRHNYQIVQRYETFYMSLFEEQ
jgi:hypothetical protein